MKPLIAVNEIHGIEVDGKPAVIAPGKTFTPNSAKQRDKLLNLGAAKLAPETEKAEDDSQPTGYAAMTVKELTTMAEERDIDLAGASKKAEIIAKIEEADTTSDELV